MEQFGNYRSVWQRTYGNRPRKPYTRKSTLNNKLSYVTIKRLRTPVKFYAIFLQLTLTARHPKHVYAMHTGWQY